MSATTTATATTNVATTTLHESMLGSIFMPSAKPSLLTLKLDAAQHVEIVGRVSESDGDSEIRDVVLLRELDNSEDELFTVLVIDECECCYYELSLDAIIAIPIYFSGVVKGDFAATDAMEHLTKDQALEFIKFKAQEFINMRSNVASQAA